MSYLAEHGLARRHDRPGQVTYEITPLGRAMVDCEESAPVLWLSQRWFRCSTGHAHPSGSWRRAAPDAP